MPTEVNYNNCQVYIIFCMFDTYQHDVSPAILL